MSAPLPPIRTPRATSAARVASAVGALIGALALGGCPLFDECETDGDCANGRSCHIGECVECELDRDCPPGLECGIGSNRCVQCDSVTDCATGEECRGDVCVAGTCRQDAECGFGVSCVEGVCDPTRCSGGGICPAGRYCDAGGACVAGSCGADGDCTTGCCKLGDCLHASVCECMEVGCARPENDFRDGCSNGIDDNGNGATDGEDPACAGAPTCGDGLCAPGETCAADCGPTVVCGDGVCGRGERCPADCGGAPACPPYAANIQPFGPPPFVCGPIPEAQAQSVALVMRDLGNLWLSDVTACACGADSPLGPFCPGNALAATEQNAAYGYVWFDPWKLAELEAQTGVGLTPAWLLAHEVGHNVQARFGVRSSFTIGQELGADCFAGFFIGSLVCRGRVNQAIVQSALFGVCDGADAAGTPWFHPQAHGTCQQRVNATLHGVNTYLSGADPVASCGAY